MIVKGYNSALLLDGPLHDLGIIGSCHIDFRNRQNIETCFSQRSQYRTIKHLVQEKSFLHYSSCKSFKVGMVDDRMAVLQGGNDLLSF